MKKILTLLITLCSSVLLQGCVPLLIFGGVAVGGVVTGVVIYDHRDTKTMMDDHEISYQAESKLNANDEIKNKTHISVSVFNRVVLLVGQSPTPQLKQIAENLVKPIPKIKLFHSEITVENPISSTRRAQDSWITTKIKSTLLAQKGLSTTQVKIITENGVVYIMGLGNRQQIDVITEKVRQTDGVKKVVKLVEYIN
jgi:osmotically-inducible protein OsmY